MGSKISSLRSRVLPCSEAASSKVTTLGAKLHSKLPQCGDYMLNDRRKIEVIAVIISAVFILATIIGSVNRNKVPPPPILIIAQPPPVVSPTHHPKVPAPPGLVPPKGPGEPVPPPDVLVPPPAPHGPEPPLVSPGGLVPPPTLPDGPGAPVPPSSTPKVTYVPGDLSVQQNGLILSRGLQSRVLARSNAAVFNAFGEPSTAFFHENPDAGACFVSPDGGWVYVSNSEVKEKKGGVGAIYFDQRGNILRYDRLLTGTTMNCGGGKTPWDTWISLEESSLGDGIWEVDPHFRRPPSLTVLGDRQPAMYESFAYDIRNSTDPKFFFTEDDRDGPVRRFSPNPGSVTTDRDKMWRMLYDDGYKHEFLILMPTATSGGTFKWSSDIDEGRTNANLYFQNSEGIDCRDGKLFFISKRQKELFALDLDKMTYQVSSTVHGAFSAPDQIVSIFPSSEPQRESVDEDHIIYFTEDGGRSEHSGIHARDIHGRYFTILESVLPIDEEEGDETTGLAFSPDRTRMYFAMQKIGILYEVWREDGHAFGGMHLDVKYHAESSDLYRR